MAIDTLTGESRVLKVDILHDVGTPINPAIDIGQIEGGFIQGVGWLTTEQLVWNDQGGLTTHAPSTYKIPATGDVPAHFRIDLWPEANREDNVGGSKAVGEPPFMLAISVWEALREAVASARTDAQETAPPVGAGADGGAGHRGERARGDRTGLPRDRIRTQRGSRRRVRADRPAPSLMPRAPAHPSAGRSRRMNAPARGRAFRPMTAPGPTRWPGRCGPA